MPMIKPYKAEKVSTETLAQKAMEVCKEMLSIICDRTSKDGEDDTSNSINTNLHYFGSGQQLKISKVADSLYSSLKEVLCHVMEETAKHAEVDCKFQIPKHTSYIGTIVKNTTIDVIARNPQHQAYLDSLIAQTNKYRFDVTSSQFLNLYYDTVLRLCERGYLFDDDPELDAIRQLLSQGAAHSNPDVSGCTSISVYPESAAATRLTTRNRVIFPYIRRLLETQKAAMVTKRRVDFLNEQTQPDDDIRHAFQVKYEEIVSQSTENQLNVSHDIMRQHMQMLAIESIKNHFPKDKVDQLRNYIKSERMLSTRSHKRYITFPSSKRPRTEELAPQYSVEEAAKLNESFVQPPVKPETVEAVMPSNVVLVNPTQPSEQTVIMPVNIPPVNDMSII